MALDLNGTTDFLELGSAPVTAVPLTLACWYNVPASRLETLISLGVSGGTHRFRLYLNTVSTLAAETTATGSAPAQMAHAGTNRWNHGAAVIESAGSRYAFADGTKSAQNTGGQTPTGINRLHIGSRIVSGVNGGFLDGQIADVCVWNVALADEEVAALAKGISPRRIRPQSLVFYAPLVRDIVDAKGGSLSVTGTTVAAHPRTYR